MFSINVKLVILYLCLEYFWLSTLSSNFYLPRFASIQQSSIELNIWYTILAYISILFSIFYICIPLTSYYSSHPWFAFSIVGFVIYSIFNFTNAALFHKYPVDLVIADTFWGTFCFTLIGVFYSNKL